ncbi:MAG: hypothetical protein ACE37K_11250 [Planctomycetota bacterium]
MSSTPVTQADVTAWEYKAHGDVFRHYDGSLNHPAMRHIKAVVNMLRRLLAERDELRARAEKAEAELSGVCDLLDTAELWEWCREDVTPTAGVKMLIDASQESAELANERFAWQIRAEEAKANGRHLRRCLLCIEQLAEGTFDPTGYEAKEIQSAAEAIYRLRRAVAAAVEGQRRRPVFAIVMGLVGAVIGAIVVWGLA